MAVVTTNYCVNPSFETNTNDWGNLGGAITRITSQFVFGSASGEFVSTQTGLEGVFMGSSTIGSSDGQTWAYSIYLRGSGNVRLIMTAHANLGDFSDTNGDVIALSTTWTRHTLTKTISQPGNTNIYGQVRCTDTDPCTFQIDGAQMELDDTATAYFDGSSTDNSFYSFAWTGTAHASTSTRTRLAGYGRIRSQFELRPY